MTVYGGMRVLDCTEGIAGPTATMHLGDFGADVLKVESPAGDRLAGEPGYVCWNRNKRVTVADPDSPSDLAELRRLIALADVVVFDWPDATLRALGLDGPSLRGARPELVHAWMPPYGASGSWVDLPAEAALLASVSGVADLHRATTERPVLPVVPVLLYAQGAIGAAGISAALLARRRSGSGREVVVSGLHAVAAMQAAVMVHTPGIIAPAMGKVGLAVIANFAPYRCKDGEWLYLAALTERFFVLALDVMGLLEVLLLPGVDGSYANVLRPDVSRAVIARMQDRFAEQDRATWLEVLDAAGVPVAAVSTREEWFDSETVAANDLRVDRQHSTLGTVSLPGVAARLSVSPASVRHLPDPMHRSVLEECWAEPRPSAPAVAPPPADDLLPGGDPPQGEEVDLPLRGLEVLDASTFVAGTFGPLILGQYGASVIKVEAPQGDPYRAFAGSFAAVNQVKRGVALDLGREADRAVFDALVARSDVLVENLRDGSRSRLGLDPTAALRANPRLVHCSMGGYGSGPLGDKPGFDPLLQAQGGLMRAQGGEGEPAMSSMLVHDIAAGTLAAIGVLAALYHRESTGRGQHVATSLAHASVMMQAGELTAFAGRRPAVTGGVDWPGPSPYEHLYQCVDGWVCVWARTPSERAAADIAYRTLPAAGGGIELPEVLTSSSVDRVIDHFARSGVPAVPVLDRFELFRDPWLAGNAVFHSIPDPHVGAYTVIRAVTDWPGSGGAPRARSFSIGEDQDEILEELGR